MQLFLLKFLLKFFTIVFLFIFVKSQDVLLKEKLLPPPVPTLKSQNPIWGNIKQNQDHFNVSNLNTFNMRYIKNGQFFKKPGPLFVMLGGEWTIDERWLKNGQMFDLAEMHNAFMYYLEHRYYGESYPTSNLETENLQYLTVDQSLADIASFINYLKNKTEFIDSKVILFGGSYGGSLATWMRQKYPNLIYAVVASSAPLLAKVNFHEYNEVIRNSLSGNCSDIINKGAKEVLKLIRLNKIEKIQKDFNLCNVINAKERIEIEYFFLHIASKIGDLVQYGNNETIFEMCNKLQVENWHSGIEYENLANFIRNDTECYGNYSHLKHSLSNISLHSGNRRQWIYQQCTQFGYFQTSWTNSSLYGQSISLNLYKNWCHDLFGQQFTLDKTEKGVKTINSNYGALNPNITRVVSIHGTNDPWHKLGIQKALNPSTPVIIVNGSSHCADLYSIDKSDPSEMIEAKLAVRKYISEWLQS